MFEYHVRRKQTAKIDLLEQFYTDKKLVTSLVDLYIAPALKRFGVDAFVDSSAGDGFLLKCLSERGIQRLVGFDVDPATEVQFPVCKKDFLQVRDPGNMKGVAVGFNPPFGDRGARAVQFVDHAVSVFCPVVMFWILPYHAVRELCQRDGFALVHVHTLMGANFVDCRKKRKVQLPSLFCVFVKPDLDVRRIVFEPRVDKVDGISARYYVRPPLTVPENGTLVLFRAIGIVKNCSFFVWNREKSVFEFFSNGKFRYACSVADVQKKCRPRVFVWLALTDPPTDLVGFLTAFIRSCMYKNSAGINDFYRWWVWRAQWVESEL